MKNISKNTIIALSLFGVSNSAFASITDGKFFVGASINVQQDAYKLNKQGVDVTDVRRDGSALGAYSKATTNSIADLVGSVKTTQTAFSKAKTDLHTAAKNEIVNNYGDSLKVIVDSINAELKKVTFGDPTGTLSNDKILTGAAGANPTVTVDNILHIANFNITSTGVSLKDRINQIQIGVQTNGGFQQSITIADDFNKGGKEYFSLIGTGGGVITINAGKVLADLTANIPARELKDLQGLISDTFNSDNQDVQSFASSETAVVNAINALKGKTGNKEFTLDGKPFNLVSLDVNNLNDKNTIAFLNAIAVATDDEILAIGAIIDPVIIDPIITTIENSEFDLLKTSASKILPSVSLLGGYAFDYGNFGFITELGIDLTSSKVGKNSEKEIEVKNLYHAYLTQKAGYRFTKNTLTYLTVGIGAKDYKAKYQGEYLQIDSKKTLANLILGIGYEHKITNSLAMFAEFNHVMSLSKMKIEEKGGEEIGTMKFRSEQVKIGARYYFK
jgi:opacity protein-like surface antigen